MAIITRSIWFSFGSKICEMKRSKIRNIIQFIVKHIEFKKVSNFFSTEKGNISQDFIKVYLAQFVIDYIYFSQ